MFGQIWYGGDNDGRMLADGFDEKWVSTLSRHALRSSPSSHRQACNKKSFKCDDYQRELAA
jgi:hypothetical protein